jgi:hypothetical protein
MSEEFSDCSVMLLNVDRLKRQMYSNILEGKYSENIALSKELIVEIGRLYLWTIEMKDKHADRNH